MGIERYRNNEKLYNFSPYQINMFSKDIRNVAPYKAILDQRRRYEPFAFRRPYQYDRYMEMMSKATPLSLVSTIPLRERWFPPYRDVVPLVEDVIIPTQITEEEAYPYTTFNPLDKNSHIILYNDNMCIANDFNYAGYSYPCKAYGKKTLYPQKLYFSMSLWWDPGVYASHTRMSVGICDKDRSNNNTNPIGGILADLIGVTAYHGYILRTSPLKTFGGDLSPGDIISFAISIYDAGPDIKIWVAKNGTWHGGGDPVAGTGETWAYLNYNNGYLPLVPAATVSFKVDANLVCFVYNDPPSGYSYWDMSDDV